MLIIVHGLSEHSGRYMNLVNYFVPKGYAVYGLDHVGHGRSPGTRVFVERFDHFVESVHQFVGLISEWLPGVPRILVAHSLGGLIGTAFLIAHQSMVDIALLSGPAVKMPESISPITITIGRILSVIVPKLGVTQLGAGGISRDPAVVQAYLDDPLVYNGKITARLGSEIFKTMQYVTGHAEQITLPLLIIHGGSDKVVDPASAKMLYERVSSTDKSLKIYEGLYHETFNEAEHLQVMADVEEWFEQRASVYFPSSSRIDSVISSTTI